MRACPVGPCSRHHESSLFTETWIVPPLRRPSAAQFDEPLLLPDPNAVGRRHFRLQQHVERHLTDKAVDKAKFDRAVRLVNRTARGLLVRGSAVRPIG